MQFASKDEQELFVQLVRMENRILANNILDFLFRNSKFNTSSFEIITMIIRSSANDQDFENKVSKFLINPKND